MDHSLGIHPYNKTIITHFRLIFSATSTIHFPNDNNLSCLLCNPRPIYGFSSHFIMIFFPLYSIWICKFYFQSCEWGDPDYQILINNIITGFIKAIKMGNINLFLYLLGVKCNTQYYRSAGGDFIVQFSGFFI